MAKYIFKLIKHNNMKKLLIISFLLFVLGIITQCQEDKTFKVPVVFEQGFKFSTNGVIQTTPYTGSGTSNMVYPGIGIPLSNGTSWGTSIVNNSVNWNTAYSWGNHTGLYRLTTWVPSWSDVTNKPIFSTVATTGSYNSLLNIPTTFPPTIHTHDYADITGNFPPFMHTHDWADITNKPEEINLQDAILLLDYVSLPQKTTDQINSLNIPTGNVGLVWDKTLGVVKIWNGSGWKILITGQ